MAKAKERDGVYQRADRPGWWCSYVQNGKRIRCKLRAATRKQAIDELNDRRRVDPLKKQLDEALERLGVVEDSDITTAKLFERYLMHQRAQIPSGNISQSTFDRLPGIIATLEKHLPDLAKDITESKIHAFIDLRSLEVAPATVAKELGALKKCLRLAVTKWKLLNKNRAAGIESPKPPNGRIRYLTPGQLRAALQTAPEWMRPVMGLAVATGCRRGELLNIRWGDVDLQKRLLYLPKTKNKEPRVLRLNGPAMQVLASMPMGQAADLLFGDVDPLKLSVYSRRVFARIGVPDASFHTLRHTAASWLVMEGVDLYATSQILGHKTLRMTQRYAHLSPEYMADSIDRLDGPMGGVWTEPPASRTLETGVPPAPETGRKSAPLSHRRVTRKRRNRRQPVNR